MRSVQITEAMILTGPCQTDERKLDEDVNMRDWRFAADQDSSGLGEGWSPYRQANQRFRDMRWKTNPS